MKDILLVCLNRTFSKELGKEDLKNITRRYWRLDKRKVDNIEYIIGAKKKQIKSVYKVKSNKVNEARKRFEFEVEEPEEDIKKKIIDILDNTDTIKFSRGGAIKYLNSEDLK